MNPTPRTRIDLLAETAEALSSTKFELALLQIKHNNLTLQRDNLQDENARLKRILDNTEGWQPGVFQRFYVWLFGCAI